MQERQCLKNATPKTLAWYQQSFKAAKVYWNRKPRSNSGLWNWGKEARPQFLSTVGSRHQCLPAVDGAGHHSGFWGTRQLPLRSAICGALVSRTCRAWMIACHRWRCGNRTRNRCPRTEKPVSELARLLASPCPRLGSYRTRCYYLSKS